MLLSVILRALRNEVTPTKLAKLYNQLTPRDQAMFIINFVKPLPPEKPKDALESLDDESLQKLRDMMLNVPKTAYK
jgi:hypothetical protein